MARSTHAGAFRRRGVAGRLVCAVSLVTGAVALASGCAAPGSGAEAGAGQTAASKAAGGLPTLAPEQVGMEVRTWLVPVDGPGLDAALVAAGGSVELTGQVVGPSADVLAGNGMRIVVLPVSAVEGFRAATGVQARDVDLGLLAGRASAPGAGLSPQEATAAIPAGLAGGVARQWVEQGARWRAVATGPSAPNAGRGGGRELAMHDSRFWAGSGPVRLLARCYPVPDTHSGTGEIRGELGAALRVELLPQVRDVADAGGGTGGELTLLPRASLAAEEDGQLLTRLALAANLPAGRALVICYAASPGDAAAVARAEAAGAGSIAAPGTVVREGTAAGGAAAALGPEAPVARPAVTVGHELLTVPAAGRSRPVAWRVLVIVPSVPGRFSPLAD